MSLFKIFYEYRSLYLIGLKNTLLISLVSLFMGTLIGFILSFMKISKSKLLKIIASIYTEIIRGTPMIIQLSIVYFGSYVVFGVEISALSAAFIAVSINSSAYVSEIIRSGLNSVDKGQVEASKSLGLNKKQTMRYIVVPQAIKTILPALGNEFVTLIKETSVASTITVAELTFVSNKIESMSFQPLVPLLIAGMLYFILTFTLSRLLKIMERKLQYD